MSINRERTADLADCAEFGRLLLARKMQVCLAESCTGGWLAQTLTSVPGSSSWFGFGFVAYADAAKVALLGVSPELIKEFGAVSESVASAMLLGALSTSNADMGISITGIAGPAGGSLAKPVGTVYIACGNAADNVCQRFQFNADRTGVRRAAADAALVLGMEWLRKTTV